MSDAEVSEHQNAQESEQNADTKPAPPNPRTEGSDAPTPPGTPMRQDDSGLTEQPGGHDDDVSGSETANRTASESGGGTIPLDQEQPDPGSAPGEEHDLQEENAETSQDQPSQ